MLELKNISKRFPDFCLKDLSFEVDQGDYFILLGESGAGKSMVLETIAGLVTAETNRTRVVSKVMVRTNCPMFVNPVMVTGIATEGVPGMALVTHAAVVTGASAANSADDQNKIRQTRKNEILFKSLWFNCIQRIHIKKGEYSRTPLYLLPIYLLTTSLMMPVTTLVLLLSLMAAV